MAMAIMYSGSLHHVLRVENVGKRGCSCTLSLLRNQRLLRREAREACAGRLGTCLEPLMAFVIELFGALVVNT
jgi:hypothetical protein